MVTTQYNRSGRSVTSGKEHSNAEEEEAGERGIWRYLDPVVENQIYQSSLT